MSLGTNDISAINASEWNIEMGSDGVHFSIEGHKRFAECFIKSLEIFFNNLFDLQE